MKKDKNNIELVVLNCFIRVIKSDGKYMLFRRGVNNPGIMQIFVKNAPKNSDNPFNKSSSTEDVVKTLVNITNEMAKSNGKKGGIKDLDRYEHVTMTINHLLHFFIEANGISMDKLCSLGEEIYGLSCNKLFGDSIEEIEKQNKEEMNDISDLNQLKAKLFQEYIIGRRNGEISCELSFDDYAKQRMNESKTINNKKFKNDDSFGQVLGKRPDGDFININERPSWLDEFI